MLEGDGEQNSEVRGEEDAVEVVLVIRGWER